MLGRLFLRIGSGLRAVGAGIATTFDVRDLFLIVGLIFLFIGLAQLSWPAAFVVPGAILTYVAILGPRAAGRSSAAEGED